MTVVNVMVGVPGSGKSTLIEKLRSPDKKESILSSDEIREVFELKNNSKVFEKMNSFLRDMVKEEELDTIFYDATNVNRRRRRSLYRNIKNWNKKTHVNIIFNSIPLSTAIERNSTRPEEDRVPFHVVKRMHRQLQIPRIGVDCDTLQVAGIPIFNSDVNYKFDNINTVEDFVKTTDERWKMELMLSDTPHDCKPWHLESVFEHINLAINNSYRKDLEIIALLHDLGKGIAKQVDKTGYATYRGHASVSAHYYLNMVALSGGRTELTEKEQDIAESIHQHMNMHNKLGKKNIRNNRLTDEVIILADEFSEIDSISKITKKDDEK